jgi:subtilisin family serine protease
MSETAIQRKSSFFQLLLSVSVFAAILLGLAAPVGTAQAAEPAGAPYIIVFKDTVNPSTAAPGLAKAYGLHPGFIYQHALKGMSAVVPLGRLTALQHDPRVAYVVADMERSISAQTVPTGIQRIFAVGNPGVDIDGTDDYRVDVDVAVIDTGIDLQHPELNVMGGVNCTVSIFFPRCDPGGDDDHYHGTHVSGTIAAIDDGDGVVGVAPGARLWAVKVLNKRGSGYSSWIVAGIDWVAANANTIEVANMSLGGSGFSQAEYDAIQGAVNKGVAFAVAAGNEADDANNYSPGGFDNVLSVSARADFNGLPGGGAASTCRADVDDTLADFSNWGPEVDIAAPGVCILSTYPLEKGEYGTISGTSMASPHAAGALALLASVNNPGNAADVYNLYNQVKTTGNFNWTDDSGDRIKEPLLDVSNTAVFDPVLVPGSGGGGGNTAPSVTITSPANGITFVSGTPITFTGTASDTQDGDLTSSLAWTSSIDGPIGTGGSFSAVLNNGTHTITAAVTDSGGLSGDATVTITVAPAGQITLSVIARQVRTNKYADLSWSGALFANVDVYRNGVFVITTPNDGAYTDKPSKTLTSATYKVCEAGTSICSNEVTVSW